MSQIEIVETVQQSWVEEGLAIIEQEEKANNWKLGELAAVGRSAGMTNLKIAKLWDCSESRVSQVIRVYDRFASVPGTEELKGAWSWRSFREMLTWDASKADQAIKWGSDFAGEFRGARFQYGPPPELVVKSPEPDPDPPLVTPMNDEPEGTLPDESIEAASVPGTEESSTPASVPGTEDIPTTPHVPPQAATQPAADTSTTLKQGTTEAIRALRTLSGLATAADKRATAQKLRKLADELDPPPAKGAFRPPTVEQVAEYCGERGNGIEAEEFCDYYESQGWKKANGLKLVDWHGAVRNWEKKDRKDGAASNSELNSSLSALARAGSG